MGRRGAIESELVQQASPATPGSGFVRVYAKADGNLYKKGPDGQEVLLSAGFAPGMRTIYKSATESVTSSTVLQDDDDLQFAIGANEVWVGRLVLWVDGAQGGDFKATVVAPAGAGGAMSVYGPASAATVSDGMTVMNSFNSLGVGITVGMIGSGIFSVVYVDFNVSNGATPGLVKLQWAQGTSNGTATRIIGGSFLTANQPGIPTVPNLGAHRAARTFSRQTWR